MKKYRVGVVGVSGYAGLELINLLMRHPAADMVAVMDAAEIGETPLKDIHPRLRGICDLTTFVPEKGRLAKLELDTVFLCTPDKASYQLAPIFLSLGIRVIDLSGAYRLKDMTSYPPWYGFQYYITTSLLPRTIPIPNCWIRPFMDWRNGMPERSLRQSLLQIRVVTPHPLYFRSFR